MQSFAATRVSPEIEAALYFCCLEAIQNAGKYAGPDARIDVTVERRDDMLWFRVVDDGAGFSVESSGEGQGFVNMRDRLGALGGTLTATSALGEGSTVTGSIPVGSD